MAPPIGNHSARLLAALEAAYREVESCLNAFDAIMASRELADQGRFSKIRLGLARANLARCQVAQEACSRLLANGAPSDGEALRDLQQSEIEHSRMISAHIQRWTPQVVQDDWRGYRSETGKLLDQVCALIAAERTLVVPLLREAR